MKNRAFLYQIIFMSVLCMMSSCSNTRGSRSHRGQSSQKMVTCPMCGGTGVFCLMPDDVFAPRSTCSGCNGTGMCTEEQANNIRGAINQANSFMNDNGISTPTRSGRSAYEIQRDLDKAYRLLADMERQYQECSSVTIAAQYPSMIQNQRERIWRLEEELRNATH